MSDRTVCFHIELLVPIITAEWYFNEINCFTDTSFTACPFYLFRIISMTCVFVALSTVAIYWLKFKLQLWRLRTPFSWQRCYCLSLHMPAKCRPCPQYQVLPTICWHHGRYRIFHSTPAKCCCHRSNFASCERFRRQPSNWQRFCQFDGHSDPSELFVNKVCPASTGCHRSVLLVTTSSGDSRPTAGQWHRAVVEPHNFPLLFSTNDRTGASADRRSSRSTDGRAATDVAMRKT